MIDNLYIFRIQNKIGIHACPSSANYAATGAFSCMTTCWGEGKIKRPAARGRLYSAVRSPVTLGLTAWQVSSAVRLYGKALSGGYALDFRDAMPCAPKTHARVCKTLINQALRHVRAQVLGIDGVVYW